MARARARKDERLILYVRHFDGDSVRRERYTSADMESAETTIHNMTFNMSDGHHFECAVIPVDDSDGKLYIVTKGKGKAHVRIDELVESEEM